MYLHSPQEDAQGPNNQDRFLSCEQQGLAEVGHSHASDVQSLKPWSLRAVCTGLKERDFITP